MHAEGQVPPPDHTATPSSDARLALLVAVCLVLGGCEDVTAIFGDLSEEMRGVEAAEGRSGTLRGLEVAHSAAAVATRISQAPSAECALSEPDGGYKYILDLQIDREARDESPVSWKETRTLVVDAEGDMRLQMNARYTDRLGNEGSHEPVRMVVGSTLYEGPDPEHLYPREAGTDGARALSADARGTFQALMDATPGWAPSEEDEGWTIGSERLRCGVADPSDQGWLRRLATRGSVVEARLEAAPKERTLKIRWLLEDGVVMQVRARDRIVGFVDDVEAPADPRITDVRRDRSWKRVHDILEQLEEDGAIERGGDVDDADE